MGARLNFSDTPAVLPRQNVIGQFRSQIIRDWPIDLLKSNVHAHRRVRVRRGVKRLMDGCHVPPLAP